MMMSALVFVFKQETAYDMRISDWSSDVCSSDLNFRDLAATMNISNDDFIRTTEPRHVTAVQALWQKLAATGNIYLGKYAGWYAVRDEAFYQEDELQDGPNGQKLAPSGAPVEWVAEPSYFFRLSARSEEHTSELQSLLRISYAVFCLKKNNFKT